LVRGSRPAAEVPIDVSLVRRLVRSQFPRWSGLAVQPVDSAGWDNAIYRLGADLAVRLPRRRIGADQTATEHRWLPVLGPQLPLAVPIPVGKGMPGEGYPWRWTVCPWLGGEIAAVASAADMNQVAMRLARFVRALQAVDPAGGPRSEFRGGSLAARDPVTQASAEALRDSLDVRPILAVWEAAVAAPAWTGPPVWTHGDLHPANLLISNGELTGVIDFGLLCVGDPACDLMVAWTYLSAGARRVFRDALAVDDATWARGRGWALHLGLMCAAYSADNQVLSNIGQYTITQVLAESGQNLHAGRARPIA
jgi:aminoglycoside phosphotransferase (APT) family kinase protein